MLPTGDELADRLTKDELLRILGAIQAMAHASAQPELTRALQGLLRISANATGSDQSAIYLLDEAADELILAGDYPGNPALAEAFRRMPVERSKTGERIVTLTARAYNVGELGWASERLAAAGVVEVAIVPLRIQDRPAGSLQLARTSARPYGAEELRFAEILAAQLSIHLENARLYSEARRRLDELRLLLDVGRTVTASLELNRILETSAEILTRMIDASNSFIMLLDSDQRVLRGVATSNAAFREQFRAVQIPVEAPSVAARAVRTRSTIVVRNAETSNEVWKELVELYGEKSVLALPLLLRDQAIGAVVIDDTRSIRNWTRSEIERAEVIAYQVAVAVANARLFEDLKQSYGELARTQEELVKRERLAALGQLAAIMAHEVRNPLGVLFNSLGTLEKMVPSAGDSAVLLTIMREEAQRLNQLVGDLLDFARPTQPAMRSESLRSLIEGAIEAASGELGASTIEVRIEVADGMPAVYLDARMMRRALLNLVLNGLQAMDRGGRLTVRAAIEGTSERTLARIDVVDSGPGIAPEIVPRVFEPFFTTKASGTGLGLAVVKSIVDAHAGELSVDSRSGDGATFTIRLPLERDARPSPPGA